MGVGVGVGRRSASHKQALPRAHRPALPLRGPAGRAAAAVAAATSLPGPVEHPARGLGASQALPLAAPALEATNAGGLAAPAHSHSAPATSRVSGSDHRKVPYLQVTEGERKSVFALQTYALRVLLQVGE